MSTSRLVDIRWSNELPFSGLGSSACSTRSLQARLERR
jgi:homoserine kinase